jgi:hypothetical protein
LGQQSYVVLVTSLKDGASPAGDAGTQAAWDWIPAAVAERGGELVAQSRTAGPYEWVVTIELASGELPGLTSFLEEETVGAPVVMAVVPEPLFTPSKKAVPRTGPGS